MACTGGAWSGAGEPWVKAPQLEPAPMPPVEVKPQPGPAVSWAPPEPLRADEQVVLGARPLGSGLSLGAGVVEQAHLGDAVVGGGNPLVASIFCGEQS